MVIDESDDEAAAGEGEEDVEGNAYRETLTSVDGFTRGPNGKVKFNKDTKKRRRENDAVDEDVEKAETPSTPPSTPPRTRRVPSLPNFAAALPKLAKPLPLPSISLPQRPGARLVWFTVAASITFILVICVAFVGGDIEQPYLKGVLDNAAKHSPGVRLGCIP